MFQEFTYPPPLNLEDGINNIQEYYSIINSSNLPSIFSIVERDELSQLGKSLEFLDNKLITGDFTYMKENLSNEEYLQFINTFFVEPVVLNGNFSNARTERQPIAYEGYKWVDPHNCKVNRKYICFH